MKTQYFTASTLNGFIASPGHSLDWLFQFGDVESSYPEFIEQVGALAMGSHTYEWLLEHNFGSESADPQPWPYTQPTWVFTTRTLPPVAGADVRFVRGDVRPVHGEMVEAAGGRNVWIVGGGDLAGQFYDHGLLDELIVQFASTTLAAGAPLFPRETNPPLRLISATAWGDAIAELRYEVPRTDEATSGIAPVSASGLPGAR